MRHDPIDGCCILWPMQFEKILEAYRRASKYWCPTLNKFAEGAGWPVVRQPLCRSSETLQCLIAAALACCSEDARSEALDGGMSSSGRDTFETE